MRRLLNNSPKGIKYEVFGKLNRATINITDDYEPFAFEPYQPYYCPVCGDDAGIERQISVILALEFASGEKYNFVAWSHKECFKTCIETAEPDADLE